MKRKSINRFSLSKIREMQEETPIRIELCKRAGALPAIRTVQIYSHGEKYEYQSVQAIAGTGVCECGCGRTPRYFEHLEPHEQTFRSHGGRLSLENSKMVLRDCHKRLQNNQLHWSKRE